MTERNDDPTEGGVERQVQVGLTTPAEHGIELTSELTCPACGHRSRHVMPTDACLFFHECAGCKTLLRPKPGDCCVFCSYGSVACPPVQEDGRCCGERRPR